MKLSKSVGEPKIYDNLPIADVTTLGTQQKQTAFV